MSTDGSPTVPRARALDLRRAGVWLDRNGLGRAQPTRLPATRLAYDRLATSAWGGFGSHSITPLAILTVLLGTLLVAQSWLDRWVRRIDQRVAADLSRRVAHPVQPGWRVLLGRPYAALVAAMFGGAVALAAGALTVSDSTVRYAAVVLLIGLCAVGAGIILQLRDMLARPVVTEDELSLIADVVMRVEDAREFTAPTVLWTLPVVLLFGTAPGWCGGATLAFLLLGSGAHALVQRRTPSSASVARQVLVAR
ncbi:hypothetical protein ACN27F_27300 [Solwaraspora sp. WMMB335]|uniref:hypothetical protein n=1 Tax=Solwaraspora sp. WMMB335 TaxID=3404118 RepID=UPI003B94D013